MKDNESKIGIIIQARLGSSRLPNKILLPFNNNENIISIIIDKLKTLQGARVILATSNLQKDIPLLNVAKEKNIDFYCGSENDVLQRFIDTSLAFNCTKFIRICSDNPFLDLSSLNDLIQQTLKSDVDYIGFKINNKPSIQTHFGFWAESTTLGTLLKVKDQTNEQLFHEHVTNYIYTHPSLFKIKWLDTPHFLQNRNDIRLTIDTESDFKLAKCIYSDLLNNCNFTEQTIDSIVEYIDEHNEYLNIMKEEINKNKK